MASTSPAIPLLLGGLFSRLAAIAAGSVSIKAENKNPGMTVARGAIAMDGTPTAAIVAAAMGTVNTMPASIRRLVSMGSSLIMLTALVMKSLLST